MIRAHQLRSASDPWRTRETRRCIVFLHIPKSGGVTLRATLRHKYPSETVEVHSWSGEAIEEVPLSDRRAARVVAGHLPYGVHRHIPQECEYITILREPVPRVISMYRYILGQPNNRFHEDLVRSGMGLEEFVRTAASPGIDNEQTRRLSGRIRGEFMSRGSDARLERTELGTEALEEAKRNLDRFLVVGLTERFDESFILIRRALGWKLPMYATRNVAKSPKGPQPAAPEAIDAIRERDQLDFELYGHARHLFSAAVDRQGSSFQREVAAFRLLNRIPNRLGPRIPARLRHTLRSVLPR